MLVNGADATVQVSVFKYEPEKSSPYSFLFFQYHSNTCIIFLSTSFLTKTRVRTLIPFYECYMNCPSHPPSLQHYNVIRRVHVKNLIIQFPSASYYSRPFGTNILIHI
jgi:hypothetical protein